MINKGARKGTTRFELRPPNGAAKVMLAGDFNGWKPRPMQKQKGGLFVAVETLPAGIYEYKFIVDDEWVADPDNNQYARNRFGTLNSVVTVGD